jgi:hypothetical protein
MEGQRNTEVGHFAQVCKEQKVTVEAALAKMVVYEVLSEEERPKADSKGTVMCLLC